jgi:hypothetical protein
MRRNSVTELISKFGSAVSIIGIVDHLSPWVPLESL